MTAKTKTKENSKVMKDDNRNLNHYGNNEQKPKMYRSFSVNIKIISKDKSINHSVQMNNNSKSSKKKKKERKLKRKKKEREKKDRLEEFSKTLKKVEKKEKNETEKNDKEQEKKDSRFKKLVKETKEFQRERLKKNLEERAKEKEQITPIRKRPGFWDRVLGRGVHVSKDNLLLRKHQRGIEKGSIGRIIEKLREKFNEFKEEKLEELAQKLAEDEFRKKVKNASEFDMPVVNHYPMSIPEGLIPAVYPHYISDEKAIPHCYHPMSEIQQLLEENFLDVKYIRSQSKQQNVKQLLPIDRVEREIEYLMADSLRKLDLKLRRDKDLNSLLLQDINLHQPQYVDGGPLPFPTPCDCRVSTRKLRPGMYRHRERFHDQCRAPSEVRPCPCNPVSGMRCGQNVGERLDDLEGLIHDADDYLENTKLQWKQAADLDKMFDVLEQSLFTGRSSTECKI